MTSNSGSQNHKNACVKKIGNPALKIIGYPVTESLMNTYYIVVLLITNIYLGSFVFNFDCFD